MALEMYDTEGATEGAITVLRGYSALKTEVFNASLAKAILDQSYDSDDMLSRIDSLSKLGIMMISPNYYQDGTDIFGALGDAGMPASLVDKFKVQYDEMRDEEYFDDRLAQNHT